MIARSLVRCSLLRGSLCGKSTPILRAASRRYSTHTPPPATSFGNASSGASPLTAFTTDLDKIAPRFEIHGEQITVLKDPVHFYETLKEKIRNAEKRVFLATLYVGKTEHELIATLREALRNKPKLKVSILTDILRGTREQPSPSCASILASLVKEFGPERVEIRMYHTPNLTGLRKKYIPKRINEGWGLQHMKLYGADDEIIISGANLSNDYFTNRQDRYHLFSSKDITDYFARIHEAVSKLSFVVSPADSPSGFELSWPHSNKGPSPLIAPKEFITTATASLAPLVLPPSQFTPSQSTTKDTIVYPLSQFSQLLTPDTSTELPAVSSILRTLSSPSFAQSSWTFTAGYFNPDPSLTSLLLNAASSRGTVITASPWANGFYGSKGISGMLPSAYTLLARRFLQAAKAAGRDSSITLKEWRKGTVGEKDGWTYHAKGLWVTLPGDKERGPSMTLVGSSNYTKRSYGLDLESNTLILTRNQGLQKRLGEEEKWLQEFAKEIKEEDFARAERRVSLKVRVAMWIVGAVGGAL